MVKTKGFSLLICFIASCLYGQKILSGRTMSENNRIVTSVLVININNNEKTSSNSSGEFSIKASLQDEIRFIKKGYERTIKRIDNLDNIPDIIMTQLPVEIEEVKIIPLSGNLAKDSKMLTKVDKKEELRKAIGLPRGPEKPREVPADTRNLLMAIPLGLLDVQGLYDIVSGKARRQRRWYQYEDMQDDIAWVKTRTGEEYFVKEGIPAERIPEFLEFSFILEPDIRRYIKAKNIYKVMFELEETLPVYVERIKESQKKEKEKQ